MPPKIAIFEDKNLINEENIAIFENSFPFPDRAFLLGDRRSPITLVGSLWQLKSYWGTLVKHVPGVNYRPCPPNHPRGNL